MASPPRPGMGIPVPHRCFRGATVDGDAWGAARWRRLVLLPVKRGDAATLLRARSPFPLARGTGGCGGGELGGSTGGRGGALGVPGAKPQPRPPLDTPSPVPPPPTGVTSVLRTAGMTPPRRFRCLPPLPWGVSGYRCRGGIGEGGYGIRLLGWHKASDQSCTGRRGPAPAVVCRPHPPPRHRGTLKSSGDLLGAGCGTPGEHRPDPPSAPSPELRARWGVGGGGGRRDISPPSQKKHKFPG